MNHRGHFQYKPLEKVSMEVIGKNGFKVHKVHKSKVALAVIDPKEGQGESNKPKQSADKRRFNSVILRRRKN